MTPTHRNPVRSLRTRPSRVAAIAFGITLFVCVLYWHRSDGSMDPTGRRRRRSRDRHGEQPEIAVSEIWQPALFDAEFTARAGLGQSIQILLPTARDGRLLPPVALIRSADAWPSPPIPRRAPRYRRFVPRVEPFSQN